MARKRTKAAKPPGNPALLLRLPENVGAALAKAAKKGKRTLQAEILAILGEHYGIEVEAPQRGSRKKQPE